LDSKEKALWFAQLALDKKAVDLELLDVQEQSSFTSYFIICSGTSDRHVQAIAAHLEASCKQAGMLPLGVEGVREGRWVLLDFADVIIHIFHEPVREFYDLERLWTAAQKVPVTIDRGTGRTHAVGNPRAVKKTKTALTKIRTRRKQR
jgi:ribosome-associated protein